MPERRTFSCEYFQTTNDRMGRICKNYKIRRWKFVDKAINNHCDTYDDTSPDITARTATKIGELIKELELYRHEMQELAERNTFLEVKFQEILDKTEKKGGKTFFPEGEPCSTS